MHVSLHHINSLTQYNNMSNTNIHITAFRFVSEDETVHGNITATAVVTPASDATMLDESSEAELESLHFVKLDGKPFNHEVLTGEDYDAFMELAFQNCEPLTRD